MVATAFAIENLDFDDARGVRRPDAALAGDGEDGPNREMVPGLNTAKLQDRLTQMATNAGLFVIALDAACTSRWGAEHWLDYLKKISADASGHHVAALVIGRRGLKTASPATKEV